MYQPIHSDFIIHWTGKPDIDDVYDPRWVDNNSSKTNATVTDLYIKRLIDILDYGLWMTKKEEDKAVIVNDKPINITWVARTCFTELRLSDVRAHAARFGRLGIGFKRFFLFDRLGSPMTYYHPIRRNWFFHPYLSISDKGQLDNYSSCFLKPACEKFVNPRNARDSVWRYTYFDESEWRIIFSEEIKQILLSKGRTDVVNLFVNPQNNSNFKYNQYYNSLGTKIKPEYIIPLDAWFSMIIYPSLEVKNEAQRNDKIKELIKQIKDKNTPGCTAEEKKNYPIGVDLDACRNF